MSGGPPSGPAGPGRHQQQTAVTGIDKNRPAGSSQMTPTVRAAREGGAGGNKRPGVTSAKARAAKHDLGAFEFPS